MALYFDTWEKITQQIVLKIFFSLVSQQLAEHLGVCKQDSDSVQLGDGKTNRTQLLVIISFMFKIKSKNFCRISELTILLTYYLLTDS